MPKKRAKRKTKRAVLRTHTEEMERLVEACLQGEKVDGLVNQLAQPDQDLFYTIVDELRHSNDSRMEDLWKIDYERTPPSMAEFLDDPYWIGEKTKITEENPLGIFPKWRELLTRDFDYDSKVNNLVLTGSLGCGKTFNMIIILLYRVVLARLLRNPAAFLGLNKGSKIFYTVLSVSKQVVEQTAFGDVKDFMSVSRFFLEECKYDPEKHYSNFCIPIGKNIFVSAGSKGWHTIGRNVMGICLDEGNFRNEANPDLSAYKLYDDARVRLQNRFQRTKGYLPAISMLASSARDESSFTEKAIEDIRKINNPKLELVYRHAAYVIKRGTSGFNLTDRWFRVSYGLKSVDPAILGGWCYEDGTIYEGSPALEMPPEGAQIEIVPDLYYDAFRRNTKTSLQGISGIATGGSFRLIQSMVDVEACITTSEREGVINPCTVSHIPLSMDDDKNIWDFLDHKRFLTRVLSRIRPIRHPEVPRYAHIDLATQNMAGIAICHPVGQALIEGLYTPDAVAPFAEYRLVVEYDFILTIVAGPNRPISLEKVQKFFFWLREQCGFTFNLVTADQYQSVLSLQMMESRGFETNQLSLDRNKGPYYAWRDAFTEHRLRLFRQGQLMLEVENLADGPKKIDHPPEGSKDTTDAAAGAYWNAISCDKANAALGANSLPLTPDNNDMEDEAPPVSIPLPKHEFERRRVEV